MELQELDNLLNHTPIVYLGDPLFLSYLDNVIIIKDYEKFLHILDCPERMDEYRYAIIDKKNNETYTRFPHINIKGDAFKSCLNSIVFDKYEQLQKSLFTQNDIANTITSIENEDVIVLLIVDGLSYLDCKNFEGVSYCFVNGPTFTSIGFRNIINNPPIVDRLYDKGFKNRYGFSYWDRTEELTNIIFRDFPKQNLYKSKEFDIILEILSNLKLHKSYIQIVVSGCDQVAHRNRDRPIINDLINRIFNDYVNKLENIFNNKKLKYKIIITADHGIWWNPKIDEKDERQFINCIDKRARRYLKNSDDSINCGKIMEAYGESYTILKYPYIFNNINNNEWGVHGGLSMYESFVPFLIKRSYHD